MQPLAVLASLLLPALLGVAILCGLSVRRSSCPLAYPGWAILAGCLAMGMFVAAWVSVGLPPDGTMLSGATVLTIAALVAARIKVLRERRSGIVPPDDRRPYRRADFLYALLVVALVVAGLRTIGGGNGRVISIGDEAELWSIKARMIYAANGSTVEFHRLAHELDRPADFYAPFDSWYAEALRALPPHVASMAASSLTRGRLFHHVDYPLLNPSLQVWIYAWADRITFWQNRWLMQACALALLLVLAGALRDTAEPAWGACLLVCWFALAETRNALATAYADGLVAAGLLVAVDCWRRYLRDRGQQWLALGAIGIAMMVWSKHEGLMYLVALVLGIAACRVPIPRRSWPWAVLPLGLLAFTWISNALFGFENDLVSENDGAVWERRDQILGYFWQHLWAGPLWPENRMGLSNNWLPILLLALIATRWRLASALPVRPLLVVIAVVTAGQLVVYLTTPHDLRWHLATSATRFSWQSLPVITLAVAALLPRRRPY